MTLMKLERVCLSSPQALPADDDGMMERTHRQVPDAPVLSKPLYGNRLANAINRHLDAELTHLTLSHWRDSPLLSVLGTSGLPNNMPAVGEPPYSHRILDDSAPLWLYDGLIAVAASQRLSLKKRPIHLEAASTA